MSEQPEQLTNFVLVDELDAGQHPGNLVIVFVHLLCDAVAACSNKRPEVSRRNMLEDINDGRLLTW